MAQSSAGLMEGQQSLLRNVCAAAFTPAAVVVESLVQKGPQKTAATGTRTGVSTGGEGAGDPP